MKKTPPLSGKKNFVLNQNSIQNCSDPTNIDFVIPANDDATKSVEVILDACCAAMQEGLEERKAEKVDMEAAGEAPANKGKKKATKAGLDKSDEEAINAAKAAAFMKEEEA